MIRNDYIMRQIEMLGAFARKLLKRIEDNELDDAGTDADAASRQFVGVPLVVLENQPPDGFESMLSAGGQFDYMRGLAAATLLELRGKLARADGDEPTAFRLWTNSASLLVLCYDSPDVEVREMSATRLENVLKALQEYEIPEFLHRLLTQHYEKLGKYSRAEDHVFQAVSASQSDVFEWARSFFERLESMTDQQLASGNFTRGEIAESVIELERLAAATASA
ncbi:MAG: hypothetical protein KDN22_18675 [Verrucomicrobiae bacterium]|nr:hypothetical protein [Verrucomicrobiae bacterium]